MAGSSIRPGTGGPRVRPALGSDGRLPTGKVDRPNHTFTMTAQEMGGQGRTATVDGKVEENGTIIANINGPNVTCKSVTVRTYRVPPDGN